MPITVSAIASLMAQADGNESDGQLLTQFANTGDSCAFTELVNRFGPMVLGICRRGVGDDHLAEDAFQATFLVLARRAADVQPPEAVSAWLYGVAVRTAREARIVLARRRVHECPVPLLPERPAPVSSISDSDTIQKLDEEIARLPSHLRVAVLMCELEGISRREAAVRLGIPEGTVSSRLAKARALLAMRLRARGISLPITLATTLTSFAVPANLLARVVNLASSSHPIPDSISFLTHGINRGLGTRKLKVTLVVFGLISASLCTAILSTAGQPTPGDSQPASFVSKSTRVRAEAPKPVEPGTILIRKLIDQRYKFITLSPDGKTETAVGTPNGWPATVGDPDVERSRNGKRAAYRGGNTVPRKNDGTDLPLFRTFVGSFPKGSDLVEIEAEVDPAFWTRDGNALVVRELPPDVDDASKIGKYYSVDLKSWKWTPIPTPEEHLLYDLSPDGQHYLTIGKDPEGKLPGKRLFLVDRTGKIIRPLTDETVSPGTATFLPDGKSVLHLAYPRSAKPVHGMSAFKLYRTAIERPKLEPIVEIPDTMTVGGFDYSPDGMWVVFGQRPRVPVDLNPAKLLDPEAETEEVEFAIVVVGMDGKNLRMLKSVKTKKPFSITLDVIDWR